MASAVDSRLAYARLSAVAMASRLPTANRGSTNSYTTSWDTTERDQWKEYRNALPNIVNGFARSDDGGGDRFLGTRTMGGFPSSLPSI